MFRFSAALLLVLIPYSIQYSGYHYDSASDEYYSEDAYSYGYGEDPLDTGGYSVAVASVIIQPANVQLSQAQSNEVATVHVSLGLMEPLGEDDSFSVIFAGPFSQSSGVPQYPDAASSEEDLFLNVDVVLECRLAPAAVQNTGAPRDTSDENGKLSWYHGDMVVPQWTTRDGVYELAYLVLVDTMGQAMYFETSSLKARGQPTSITVSGALHDGDAPRVVGMDVPFTVRGPMADETAGASYRREAYLQYQQLEQTELGAHKLPKTLMQKKPVVHGANVTVIVVERMSGLADLADSSVITGSHIQLQSADSPGPQVLSFHFDDTNEVAPMDVAKQTPLVQRALRSYRGAKAYTIRIEFPSYAWTGRWDIVTVHVVDKVGSREAKSLIRFDA
eukprot:m.679225 g.679225  ORF g.679225 m.679225 type:complete len:390 (-) comp22810_c0_seq15:2991-4160(-)